MPPPSQALHLMALETVLSASAANSTATDPNQLILTSKGIVYIVLAIVELIFFPTTIYMFVQQSRLGEAEILQRSVSVTVIGQSCALVVAIVYLLQTSFYGHFPCFVVLWCTYLGVILWSLCMLARALRLYYLYMVNMAKIEGRGNMELRLKHIRMYEMIQSQQEAREKEKQQLAVQKATADKDGVSGGLMNGFGNGLREFRGSNFNTNAPGETGKAVRSVGSGHDRSFSSTATGGGNAGAGGDWEDTASNQPLSPKLSAVGEDGAQRQRRVPSQGAFSGLAERFSSLIGVGNRGNRRVPSNSTHGSSTRRTNSLSGSQQQQQQHNVHDYDGRSSHGGPTGHSFEMAVVPTGTATGGATAVSQSSRSVANFSTTGGPVASDKIEILDATPSHMVDDNDAHNFRHMYAPFPLMPGQDSSNVEQTFTIPKPPGHRSGGDGAGRAKRSLIAKLLGKDAADDDNPWYMNPKYAVTEKRLLILIAVSAAFLSVLTLSIQIPSHYFTLIPVQMLCPNGVWEYYAIYAFLAVFALFVLPLISFRIWPIRDGYGIRNDVVLSTVLAFLVMIMFAVQIGRGEHQPDLFWDSYFWAVCTLNISQTTAVVIPLYNAYKRRQAVKNHLVEVIDTNRPAGLNQVVAPIGALGIDGEGAGKGMDLIGGGGLNSTAIAPSSRIAFGGAQNNLNNGGAGSLFGGHATGGGIMGIGGGTTGSVLGYEIKGTGINARLRSREYFYALLDDPETFDRLRVYSAANFCAEVTMFIEEYQQLKRIVYLALYSLDARRRRHSLEDDDDDEGVVTGEGMSDIGSIHSGSNPAIAGKPEFDISADMGGAGGLQPLDAGDDINDAASHYSEKRPRPTSLSYNNPYDNSHHSAAAAAAPAAPSETGSNSVNGGGPKVIEGMVLNPSSMNVTPIRATIMRTLFMAECITNVEAGHDDGVGAATTMAADLRSVPTSCRSEFYGFYATFIAQGSTLQVNIGGKTADKITKKIRNNRYTVDMFDDAREEVLDLLYENIFTKFVRTHKM